MSYPFAVRDVAQALHMLAEFCHIGPAEARELSRVLTDFADEADPQPRPSADDLLKDLRRLVVNMRADSEAGRQHRGNHWLDQPEREAE